jgi:hypothetical protein
VARQICLPGVEVRLVAVGLEDGTLMTVRDDARRHAQVLEGVDAGRDPGRQIGREARLGVGAEV